MGGLQSTSKDKKKAQTVNESSSNSPKEISKQSSEQKPLVQQNIKNADKKQQILKIVLGEIGPQNLTKEECIKMIHTIQNRIEHKDIQSDIYSQKQYTSLQTPEKEYKLTKVQQQILEQAWRQKDKTPNSGKLGWDLNKNAVKSNKDYVWKSQENKTGVHFYYDAVKVEEKKEDKK